MNDVLAAMLQALEDRDDDSTSPRLPLQPRRSPDENTPYQSEPYRGPRRRTHRDPTGEQAIGNIKKEKR